uniref:Cyclin C-terminal domain-containing protein n=1 Tax=Glossina brevipalpis TaxID=37001 RepID=A0A1A9X0I0_9MUSC
MISTKHIKGDNENKVIETKTKLENIGRRTVLGAMQNCNIVRPMASVLKKKSESSKSNLPKFKNPYKDVKAKVDSHWKKFPIAPRNVSKTTTKESKSEPVAVPTTVASATPLPFNLMRSLPIRILRRFLKVAEADCNQCVMSEYLVDLVEPNMAYYKSSEIAAASLFLSLNLLSGKTKMSLGFNDSYWTTALQRYTRYEVEELKPVARKIATIACNSKPVKFEIGKYRSQKHREMSQHEELYGESDYILVLSFIFVLVIIMQEYLNQSIKSEPILCRSISKSKKNNFN